MKKKCSLGYYTPIAEFNKSGSPAGHDFMRTGRNLHFAGPNVRHNFSAILIQKETSTKMYTPFLIWLN